MSIWLDVTTVLSWNRPAVGVVRLEAETAKHALNLELEDFNFCRFVIGSGYLQVDKADLLDALERINASELKLKKESHGIIQNEYPDNTFKRRIKNSILKLIRKLPSKWQIRISKSILNTKNLLADLKNRNHHKKIANYFRSHKRVFSASQDNDLSTPFEKGDVYISMGADWNYGDMDHLYSIKKQYELKIILFCYDLIPIKFPHMTLEWVADIFPKYYYNIAWCADELFAISECSKRDAESFLEELGAPIPNVNILKLGSEIPNTAVNTAPPHIKELIKNKYILYVSTIERRKNHETLYRAYTRLIDEGVTELPLLIFVGMEGWGVSELMADLRLDRRIKNHIIILNNITDSQLNTLYSNAMFTVYPSLYEGWGLPVAESLAFGKFCIASNVSSIPEVGGDLIEYIDPWDVQEWASRLLWFFKNPDEIISREKHIKNSYRPTTWAETTTKIIECALKL